jgi:NAD(P)-dependent dehydrogenase (short-subunit alcohol dehydrogenase family)
MTTRLGQKVAIVTGAGSGIGCATAKLFAREGASVVIADIDPLGKTTEDTIREHGGKEALFVSTDVTLEEDVKRMIETAVDRYGRVDILVNGAGLATPGDALKLSEEDWDSCMAVNLKGGWYCSKHAIRHMPKTGGSIVNIASTHPLRFQPNFFPYAVAKGGMLAMTGSLAIDFGPRGVRANSICPGFIDTPMNSTALSKLRESPKQFQKFLALHPLRCLGRVEDVAYACLFLASDESRFITGTALIVDGGRTAFGRYFEEPVLLAGDHSDCNAK